MKQIAVENTGRLTYRADSSAAEEASWLCQNKTRSMATADTNFEIMNSG